MRVFEFYIFTNAGDCIFSLDFSVELVQQQRQKLIFGLLFALKDLCRKLSSSAVTTNPFTSYLTPNYKFHMWETATGLNFVMLTEKEAGDHTRTLQFIHQDLFVNVILRNPFYTPKGPINCSIFRDQLKSYLLGVPK
mmetsp:Transcript_7687/g.14553  ORF Transcript_7687/g.14553 Transcript_7687/m.14553 type:complete len:137 (-) Transcript_7687:1627-2037(-)